LVKEFFYRRELKYLLPNDTYLALLDALMPYMKADTFGVDGKYAISSLYFDSPDHAIYWETANKLPIRQKLRLRTYEQSERGGIAFFEIKQKVNRWVHKRRTMLTLEEGYRFVDLWSQPKQVHIASSNEQVAREIWYFQQTYRLEPRVIVRYERHALEGMNDPELRITFDRKLTCRSSSLLLEVDEAEQHFVDPDLVIMEVKAGYSIPAWLSRLLAEYGCQRSGVSKYLSSVDVACPIDKPTST
jgi:hypothetical protein